MSYSRVKEWLLERLPLDLEPLRTFGSEPVPHHLKHWWWALGGTPGYLFLVQVFTGLLLAFYYVPDIDHAYDSVYNITENISYGWYIRSIHHWTTNFMVASVILHMIRVFFTGSYRRPRELNWMIGCLLLMFTFLMGFTGYSLVSEQLSYWGLTVVGNLMEAVPFFGDTLAGFFRAGSSISQLTLSRMFALHALIFPAIIFALIFVHFLIMHAHGITRFHFDEERDAKPFPFVPDHLVGELVIAVTLMIILTFLAIVFPAGLGDKANPLVVPPHIKPEWYFYFTFRILKLTSLTVAVLGIGAGFFIMLFWPFLDRLLRRKNPNGEISMLIGGLVVLTLIGLTLWEAIAIFTSH